jgi:hypothetical protein
MIAGMGTNDCGHGSSMIAGTNNVSVGGHPH